VEKTRAGVKEEKGSQHGASEMVERWNRIYGENSTQQST